MPELEIHHESEHAIDPAGQRVGVLAAVLAVVLAIVSIASHRTHTEAIMQKSSANDAWAHYQATRVKFHNLELGESLVGALGAKGDANRKVGRQVRRARERLCSARQEDPGRSGAGRPCGRSAEHRALRFDLGEGLLEIALVLSSLYFISRKRLFPVIGIVAGSRGRQSPSPVC